MKINYRFERLNEQFSILHKNSDSATQGKLYGGACSKIQRKRPEIVENALIFWFK